MTVSIASLTSSDGDEKSSLETKSGEIMSTDDSLNKCDTLELDTGLNDRLVRSRDNGQNIGLVPYSDTGLNDGPDQSRDTGLEGGLEHSGGCEPESLHGYTDVVDLICTEQVNYSTTQAKPDPTFTTITLGNKLYALCFYFIFYTFTTVSCTLKYFTSFFLLRNDNSQLCCGVTLKTGGFK